MSDPVGTTTINHYIFDVIISVGYREKSRQGTQFRIRATQRLRVREVTRQTCRMRLCRSCCTSAEALSAG